MKFNQHSNNPNNLLSEQEKKLQNQNESNQTKQFIIDQKLYKIDNRSNNEIILTGKLTKALTQLNLKRLQKISISQKKNKQIDKQSTISSNKSSFSQTLIITLSGIPPFQKEFDHLNIPLQHKIHIILAGFQQNISQEQLKKRTQFGNLYKMADQINQKIKDYEQLLLNKRKKKINNLIFAYHSYGTFILSYYLKCYGQVQKNRIKGLIQIGAVPIRIYPMLQDAIRKIFPLSQQFIRQNIDMIFSMFLIQIEKIKQQEGANFIPIKNKYSFLSFLLSYKTKDYQEVFTWIRNYPKVLKLFIYGENDMIFIPKNLDQKAIYYTHCKYTQLDQSYQAKLKEKFQRLSIQKNIEFKPTNKDYKLQQRFIYKLPKGKHSLHRQKELIPIISNAINQYLNVIL